MFPRALLLILGLIFLPFRFVIPLVFSSASSATSVLKVLPLVLVLLLHFLLWPIAYGGLHFANY